MFNWIKYTTDLKVLLVGNVGHVGKGGNGIVSDLLSICSSLVY